MSLFSSKSNGELVLILDVQSSSVNGSLVQYSEMGAPKVLFTYLAETHWRNHVDSNYLINSILEATVETVEAVLRHLHLISGNKTIPQMVSSVQYVLSSPWILSQAKTLSYKFPKKKTISRAGVLDLINKEREKMPDSDANVETIEEKIFDISLNGYSIGELEGKESDDLRVSYTVSVAGKGMIQRFTEITKKYFPRTKTGFHSSLLLQLLALNHVFPGHNAFVLVHVHGELTDCAVINGNSCNFFGSFPFGINTSLRKIAQVNKSDLQVASSLVSLYLTKSLDKEHSSALFNTVKQISAAWQKGLKTLFESEKSLSVPPVYIVSAAVLEDFFVQTIGELYPRAQVSTITLADIKESVSFDANARMGIPHAMNAMAIHILRQNGNMI